MIQKIMCLEIAWFSSKLRGFPRNCVVFLEIAWFSSKLRGFPFTLQTNTTDRVNSRRGKKKTTQF